MEFDLWSNDECLNLFIENNSELFEEYCKQINIWPTEDHYWKLHFCLDNSKSFEEFAANFEQDLIAEKADKDNEALKEKDWE